MSVSIGLLFIGQVIVLAMYASARSRLQEVSAKRLEAEEQANKNWQAAELFRSGQDSLNLEVVRLQTRLEAAEASTAEKVATLDKAERRFQEVFRGLSGEALKANNEQFLTLAKTAFEKLQNSSQGDLEKRQQSILQMVVPVKESLKQMDEKLQRMEESRAREASRLGEQIRGQAELAEKLRKETHNLVDALRRPSVRGGWGEMQLRRAVEFAGMIEHCHFEQQASTDTEGGRQRPDLIVDLPNGRKIIIDAKAPLEAYLAALEADDEVLRKRLLGEHARQVKARAVELGRKGYWKQFDDAPEFVVLFLPNEALFSAALEQDPELIATAANDQVIITTPTTLIALLKAVAYGWQQVEAARRANDIARLGRDLYDRVRVMAGHFSDVGKSLDRGVGSYNKAIASLESRVLVSARKFEEMGMLGDQGKIEEPTAVERRVRELPAELFPERPAIEGEAERKPAPKKKRASRKRTAASTSVAQPESNGQQLPESPAQD